MSRRNENSGLIDLDALMREASRTEAPVPSSSSPSRSKPPAEPTSKPEAKPESKSKADAKPKKETDSTNRGVRPSDSLEAVTATAAATPDAPEKAAGPETDPWSEHTPAETPGARKRHRPSAQSKRFAIGAALAVCALGAAFFVAVRGNRAHDDNKVMTVAPTGVPSNFAKPADAPKDDAPKDSVLHADELPGPAASASAASSVGPATGNVAVGAGKAVAAKAPESAGRDAGAESESKLTEAALAGVGPSGGNDLGDAMRGAVGPRTEAATTDARVERSASQLRPSPGAVVGALGSVMPSARACLAPDDPVRSGLVVFQSDGTVARIEISGKDPHDDCVRAALSKAKVAPFVDETFSTRVTVRP